MVLVRMCMNCSDVSIKDSARLTVIHDYLSHSCGCNPFSAAFISCMWTKFPYTASTHLLSHTSRLTCSGGVGISYHWGSSILSLQLIQKWAVGVCAPYVHVAFHDVCVGVVI